MPGLCRIDLARRHEYRARIESFASELRGRYRLSRVVLFGSFARGEEDVHEMSDVDLVIVGDVPGTFLERIRAMLDLTRLPIEPWVYTDAEWNEMVGEGSTFAQEVLETGVDL